MRSGANSVQHLLTPAALGVLKHAVTEARRRGHPQVQPLHVVSMLLTHAGSRLRQACMLSHPQNSQTAECRALEVCFNVALDHLPQSAMAAASQPILSNALMAALKRAHAHQRRGCPEHQQSPLLAVKVEIDQLIISILDDPSVSRVMKEAGFSSTNVKFNLEDGPAAVTVASGVGHEQQTPKHGVDMVSQGGPLYENSCVIQEENETKSSVKISSAVMNQANSMSSWQQSEVSLEGEPREMMFRAASRTNRVVGPAVGLPSREEDVRNILDIFLRPRNKNAILIGHTAVGANSVVEDLAVRIKNGHVPAQLQGLQFLDPKLSSSSFGHCSSLEMEQKLAELSKIVEECMPVGAILHIGDLQWLAEPMQLKKGPSNFCPAQRAASELRQLLMQHANNRLWFVGVVTQNIFARLQVLYPSLTSDWGLQPVQITTSIQSSQPTFLQRFSSSLQNVNDQQTMNYPAARASSPMVTSIVQDSRHAGKNGVTDRFQCCPDCLSKFEEERRQIHENESLSLQLAPVKWFSLSSDEATSGGANGAMSQNQSVVQQLAQLQQKWQKACRTLHGEPAPVLTNQTRPQLQSPLSRLSASSHSKPCGLGLDISPRWSSPENRHLGSSVVDQPLRTPSSIPMYTMHASREHAVSPLQSSVRVQDAVTSVGANVKASEAPDLGSPKDGSSVASAPEDHEDPNGSTGTSAQDAALAPIHTNLALGRANTVGSILMASKLKAPKPLTQPSPLQSMGASPLQSLRASPLQSLRASPLQSVRANSLQSVGASPMSLKNNGNPPWLMQSPLQQRRPVANSTSQGSLSLQSSPSPLAKRQAHITKSPSPPPTFKEVTVDANLKGLYKGLMQRVPWQAAAIAKISATVMKCRSGMGPFRGATAKTDTWLLLLGPDSVAKHTIAKALAELVFGGERSLLHMGFGDGSRANLEADDNGTRYRGRTPLDRLAEAVKVKPSAVILLEDIDKASNVMRTSIVRAMEIGKLADSNGREVSFSNTIVVMTTSVGSEICEPKARPGSLSFSEGKLAALGSTDICGRIKDSRSDKVIFEAPNRKVVVVDHGERQEKEALVSANRSPVEVPFWVQKRKPDSLLNGELRPKLDGKRTKSGEGRFLNLDLNLATGDLGEENCWTGESQSTWVDDQSAKDCDDEDAKLQKLLAKARFALSDKFCALPDYAVGFDSYDFHGLAAEVLNSLGKSLETYAPCEVGLEVDLQLLEHIISCVWKMPGGRQAFNTWLDDVFAKSLADTRLCGGSVVELVAELPEVNDGVAALPHSIVFGSTLAV